MMSFTKKLIRHSIVQNILYLYGVRISGYIIPLITLPYLARVIGADAFGLVAFAQSFALWLALLVEYGFNLSATREVARYRGDATKISSIAAGVLGAKGILLFVSFVVTGICWLAIPLLKENFDIMIWAWLSAVTQGLSPLWYFQGIERMRLPALLEICNRIIVMLGIFLLVKSAQDAWKILALQACGNGISFILPYWFMYKQVQFKFPAYSDIRRALVSGFSMFFFQSAASLYTTANSFILGLFAAPSHIAYYAGAERIAKALLALTSPISQALFPRLSHTIAKNHENARRLVKYSFFLMGLFGSLMAAGLIVFAPLLVDILLGPGYEAAVPILRMLALLLPTIALSNVFGIQWMIPLGMDRIFNRIIFSAGIINLILAVMFAPRFLSMGMAWAVIISEFYVTLTMFVTLSRRGLNPLKSERT